MLQDIGQQYYDCTFKKEYPKITDFLLYAEGRNFLMKHTRTGEEFPTFENSYLREFFDSDGTISRDVWRDQVRRKYADMSLLRTIAIGDRTFYIVDTDSVFSRNQADDFILVKSRSLRHYQPSELYFGAVTAAQIARWRSEHKYCGRCGSRMQDSETERAMVCKECNAVVYPKICPAVTISIIHEDKILLARNKNGAFRKYGQIAGYVEIGETFEDTVRREALEETGLKLKNIKYYKNQPWALTDAHMIGFTAEVDGSAEILLQEAELQDARWFAADEIPADISDVSLTYEMIGNFRREYGKKLCDSDRSEAFREFFDIVKQAQDS